MPGRNRTGQTAAALAAIILLYAVAAFGQVNTATISGIVQDPSGLVVPKATVVATQTDTQRKFTAATDATGEYLLSQLPVGQYHLIVTAHGFKQAVQTGVTVHAGQQLRESFALQLGSESQVVTVTVAPGILQLQSAAIQNVVQQKQVINLPLKGRQFIDLVQLTPGINAPPGGTRGGALQQTGHTYGVLGQRGGHNLYLVDGASVTDEYYNNLVLSPSVDAIQEVNIDQTSYDAEFGGKSGAVINVVTKSGSNQIHGSLFEFVRNNAFDAKNFFDSSSQPIPPFKQNQFGGTLGGPIQKNKTFFFLSYEGERIHKSQTQLFTVPTDAERKGIFQGTGITIYDPSTTDPLTGARQPFAGDTILNIDPVAAALMAKFPPANLPGLTNNLRATDLATTSVNQYTARIDHTFSANDNTFVRASVFDANQFNPFGIGALNETLLPGYGYNLRTHTDNIVASWVHVFNTSWLNELRFGWMWVGGGQSSPSAGIDFSGMTGLQGVTSNSLDTGFPQASITGLTTMGEPTQYVSRVDSNYELYDNVLWHHGTHTVKFGVYFFHLNFNPVDPRNARGLFQFTNNWTSSSSNPAAATGGSALADFLLGYPTLGQVGIGGRGALQGRTNWLQLYIADGWQILPNLKLDVGLRYEYNQNVTDANNNMSVVNTLVPGGQFVIASNNANQISPAANALLGNIPIPYVTSSELGWDRSLLASRPLRLAPRIGIAWGLPDQKTVIRAGFGIYTNQAAYSVIQAETLNLPFFYAKTVAESAASGIPVFNTENILTAPATGAVAANNVKHDFKIEYNNVWNLTVERRLSSTSTIQAQYVGSRTVHADNLALQNLFPGGLTSSDPLHVRPIPQMSGFTATTWDGWETYNALTMTFIQHAWRGLVLDANYTWSKAIDSASNPGPDKAGTNLPQDPTNMAAEKGLSDFNHTHRLVASFLYQLPFLRNSQGWIHTAFAGWQAGGIWTLESGSPFTVNLSYDNANNGTPVMSQRPDLVCDPNSGPQTPQEWFNTSCFVAPLPLAYGNAGRDIVIGPGLNNFDATFQKDFPVRENMTLQFRADMFNFFNHPNFNLPNRIFTNTSSNFGSISSARDPRQMQFSLRLAF